MQSEKLTKSFLCNLVNLEIPEDPESTGGLYLELAYYHKNETQQTFARLLILKSEENFCLLMEDHANVFLDSGQSTKCGEIKAKVYTRAVDKEKLFNELSKSNFLDIEEYTVHGIKKVSHRFWSDFPSLSEETVNLKIVIDGTTEVKVSLN